MTGIMKTCMGFSWIGNFIKGPNSSTHSPDMPKNQSRMKYLVAFPCELSITGQCTAPPALMNKCHTSSRAPREINEYSDLRGRVIESSSMEQTAAFAGSPLRCVVCGIQWGG